MKARYVAKLVRVFVTHRKSHVHFFYKSQVGTEFVKVMRLIRKVT